MKFYSEGDNDVLTSDLERTISAQAHDLLGDDRRVLSIALTVEKSQSLGLLRRVAVTARIRHVRSQLIEVQASHTKPEVAARRALQKCQRALNRAYRRRFIRLPTLGAG